VLERVFSTHPMDATRIDKTQQEIQTILPPKPEYVVNTSEYRNMRERVIARESRRPSEDQSGKPKLRVKSGTGKNDPVDDSDERPTVKRRELE
jgi:hypothetical protein